MYFGVKSKILSWMKNMDIYTSVKKINGAIYEFKIAPRFSMFELTVFKNGVLDYKTNHFTVEDAMYAGEVFFKSVKN